MTRTSQHHAGAPVAPAFLFILAIGLAFGCAADKSSHILTPSENVQPPTCPTFSPQPATNSLGIIFAEADGIIDRQTIEVPPDATAVYIRAIDRSEPVGACWQIYRYTDSDGEELVNEPRGRIDFGQYCRSCSNRAYIGDRYSLFVLPNSGAEITSGPASFSLQARDCKTFAPVSGNGLAAEIDFRTYASAEPTELILAPVALPGSEFYPSEAKESASLLAEVLADLAQIYLAAGITIFFLDPIKAPEEISGSPVFGPGAFAELDSVYAGVRTEMEKVCPGAGAGATPLIFAGCLTYRDSIFLSQSQLYGFTPRIPGGLSPGDLSDGVYIGGGCNRNLKSFWGNHQSALARTIAHELGHFLGLYHVLDPDGVADLFDDTDAENLMRYDPVGANPSVFLSAMQQQVIKNHPLFAGQSLANAAAGRD